MTDLTIQVTAEAFDLAVSERLRLITCQFDPAADKALQEDKLEPKTVTIRVRGGKRTADFAVIGNDVVLPGYMVRTRCGSIMLYKIRRRTARVILGKKLPAHEPEQTAE
jgi:hypothetical protein